VGEITILGAGLAGLATSFHVGHEKCTIYESKPYYGGHIYSTLRDGFTWDDGPHVSFNPGEYVRNYLPKRRCQFVEGQTYVSNYFRGNWIGIRPTKYIKFRNRCAECLNSFQEPEEIRVVKTRQPIKYEAFGLYSQRPSAAYGNTGQ
jgi:phytoene dehydrogenase-like protein